MPLNLMILTIYFTIDPNNIRGGIGYRYVGLYDSLAKALLKHSQNSKVFWYSHSDQSPRIINRTGVYKTKATMLKATVNGFSERARIVS
jgi:hypothetical protein